VASVDSTRVTSPGISPGIDVSASWLQSQSVDKFEGFINKLGPPVPRGGVDKTLEFINTSVRSDWRLTSRAASQKSLLGIVSHRSRTELLLVAVVVQLSLTMLAGCNDRPKAGAQSPREVQAKQPAKVEKKKSASTKKMSPVIDPAGANPITTPRAPVAPMQAESSLAIDPPSPGAAPSQEKPFAADEFDLPEIDEAKAAAAGIRKVEGKHITIYTDVPDEGKIGEEVRELTKVFDAAVPLYADYFQIDRAKIAGWKVVGYLIQDKERFQGAGLFPSFLPPFLNGYTHGSQFWWYEQPSDYYRRHLMIHEGVHAFMFRWLGGAGPPWYTEGMAELLGTHRWQDGKLELAYMPPTKEEVPYWGRVKIVKDQFAADHGLQLTDIMRFNAQAHVRNEAYGWCWAAAHFLDAHPLTHEAFRDLQNDVTNRSDDFSSRFVEKLKADWPTIVEDWQLFVVNIEYGYDVTRAAVLRKELQELPPAGASTMIAVDRGWQSTGFAVEAGTTYQIEASGQFKIGGGDKPWLCEPNGITLHYYRGRPIGLLMAGVSEVDETARGLTPLTRPIEVGASSQFTPEHSGVLYLSVNESAAELGDNEGTISVKITPKP
jgi:hypothetical protein